MELELEGCFRLGKDTNLKANHSQRKTARYPIILRCFRLGKDTNLKANHNLIASYSILAIVVFAWAKILI